MADAEFPMAVKGPPEADPTARTIDQLRREIGGLRELIEARLDGNDRAINLLQRQADSQPTTSVLDMALKSLAERMGLQFASSKDAVTAAMSSSQMAIAKSEAATAKQLDAVGVLIASTVAAIDGKIADMKDRITIIESRATGGKEAYGYVVGGVGLLLTLLTIAGFMLANRAAQGG